MTRQKMYKAVEKKAEEATIGISMRIGYNKNIGIPIGIFTRKLFIRR